MKTRNARFIAGLLISPLLLPLLQMFYVVFLSGYGRTGGYGSAGVPITGRGFQKFLTEYFVPELFLVYILVGVVAIPLLMLLRRLGRLNSPSIIFVSLGIVCIFILIATGISMVVGGFGIAGLFLLPLVGVPTFLVALAFCLIAGLPWRMSRTDEGADRQIDRIGRVGPRAG